MPQSFSAIYAHIVFSTLDRQPFLKNRELRLETHRYVGGVSKNHGCVALAVGGVEDHLHLLVNLGREMTVANLVRDARRASNLWLKSKGISEFGWQPGYGAFSVSQGQLPQVVQYIARQEIHHQEVSFQEEFLALLREHDLKWDDHYIWQ